MPGNHKAITIDQDRIRPAELTDRQRDLGDLLLAMSPGVFRIGFEPRDRAVFDLEVANGAGH